MLYLLGLRITRCLEERIPLGLRQPAFGWFRGLRERRCRPDAWAAAGCGLYCVASASAVARASRRPTMARARPGERARAAPAACAGLRSTRRGLLSGRLHLWTACRRRFQAALQQGQLQRQGGRLVLAGRGALEGADRAEDSFRRRSLRDLGQRLRRLRRLLQQLACARAYQQQASQVVLHLPVEAPQVEAALRHGADCLQPLLASPRKDVARRGPAPFRRRPCPASRARVPG